MNEIVEKILQNPLFLKLQLVIENNSYHNHEKTYDHLIKTFEIAKLQIRGNFIQNQVAKKLFLEFANNPFDNLTNGEIMLLTALLHDVGKILSYKDGFKEFNLRHENSEGIVSNPGHEYWGSTIVDKFVKDTGLSEKEIEKISETVRLHGTFGADYFEPKLNLSIKEIVDDIKARAEELYIEALFNVYCDCFTAKPFEKSKEKIIEVFNQPNLYTKRTYFIK